MTSSQTTLEGQLLALTSGSGFVCVRPDGDIGAGPRSGEGFYSRDTRHLSVLRLTVGGHEPVLLSCTTESGHHAVIDATNPELGGGEAVVPRATLHIRRTVVIAERLHYEVRLHNFDQRVLRTTVELVLGADFADVFEVRQVARRSGGRVLSPSFDAGRLSFAHVAPDGQHRRTSVELRPAPTGVGVDGERARAVWEIELGVGETWALAAAVAADGSRGPGPSLVQATRHLDDAHREWERACAHITTDNELFDRLVDASMRDLHALMMPAAGGVLPAAGIPWYVAPFGRDSLLTACEALMVNPDVARGTLLVLAGLQAREDDPWRDAEPGKVLHELRSGELARTGQVPHTPYYGTVDATPLLLMVAGEYFRWTGDLETLAFLRPALDRALEWIDRWGDSDGDGFVEYARRSPAGLINQGWKDSAMAVVHADGSLAEGPIALVEVQGYVYEAKMQVAGVYEALGDQERGHRLRAEAAALRVAFNEAFWNPEEGFYALALDGRKRQVASVASNAAHCLYCGIADAGKAAAVAERLMAPDMFSGWGMRTLSAGSPAYNPMSYHNGSVWPHDNAIAAAGLKRYGFHAAAGRIADALFDVAEQAPDFRLPELFCGFSRGATRSMVAYPVACSPQAWAAAAPFMLLQTVLGIAPAAGENRVTVDQPRLPDRLGRAELSDLRVGRSRVTLSFQRTETGSTSLALPAHDGDVEVTMSP